MNAESRAPPYYHSSADDDDEDEDDDGTEDQEYQPMEEDDVDDEDEDIDDSDDIVEFLDADDGLLEDEIEEEIELDDEDGGLGDPARVLLDIFNGATEDEDSTGIGGGVAAEDDDEQPTATIIAGEQGQRQMRVTREQLLRLLNQANFVRVMRNSEDDEEGQVRGYGGFRRSARRRQKPAGDQYPKIPSEAGRELMESGNFGTNDRCDTQIEHKKKLAARIMRRELGLASPGRERYVNRIAAQEMIPSSNADTIIHYDHRCYSGQFSDDGNFFFSCSQDFRVRMYDTSNPYSWKYYKEVLYPYGQWTITDASLSPDNKFLAYSSIKSSVSLAATDPDDQSEPLELDFANYGGGGGRRRARAGWSGWSSGHFGIWSIRFSGDGRELVAGTSDNSVYAYDLETRQTVLSIHGHEDDVNAVCFGDKMSPHLLYSGSDDTMLKVWDRRSMSDNREAGVFFGHREGITYVDSKGDGRYVLSNGKDQTMKLWDLRKMMSTEASRNIDPSQYSCGFDYRFQNYPEEDYEAHPHDCSVVTFRGHKVLKTLIRCHFSPPGSTDSRYVYSGSEDGAVLIYNLDATIAGRVDVTRATRGTRPRVQDDEDGMMAYYEDDARRSGAWKTCVRDASWHPNAPVIAATSWNGYGMHHGTCTVHTWTDGLDDDEVGMGTRVDAKLQHDRSLYEESLPSVRQRVRATRLRRNNYWDEDD